MVNILFNEVNVKKRKEKKKKSVFIFIFTGTEKTLRPTESIKKHLSVHNNTFIKMIKYLGSMVSGLILYSTFDSENKQGKRITIETIYNS